MQPAIVCVFRRQMRRPCNFIPSLPSAYPRSDVLPPIAFLLHYPETSVFMEIFATIRDGVGTLLLSSSNLIRWGSGDVNFIRFYRDMTHSFVLDYNNLLTVITYLLSKVCKYLYGWKFGEIDQFDFLINAKVIFQITSKVYRYRVENLGKWINLTLFSIKIFEETS